MSRVRCGSDSFWGQFARPAAPIQAPSPPIGDNKRPFTPCYRRSTAATGPFRPDRRDPRSPAPTPEASRPKARRAGCRHRAASRGYRWLSAQSPPIAAKGSARSTDDKTGAGVQSRTTAGGFRRGPAHRQSARPPPPAPRRGATSAVKGGKAGADARAARPILRHSPSGGHRGQQGTPDQEIFGKHPRTARSFTHPDGNYLGGKVSF